MKITESKFFHPFLFALVLTTMLGLSTTLMYYEKYTIDTTVETIDGKLYKTAEAHSYDNGMTYIGYPYDISIPTRTIKIIYR